MTDVLIVDRELTLAAALARELTLARPNAATGVTMFMEVRAEADFGKARARLKATPPALMVTALQLGEYNGMHLVYAAAGLPTRCVVHTDAVDPVHAREARAAKAFYEIRSRLHAALHKYAAAALPSQDRRDPLHFDRRRLARGGRRAADSRPSI